MQMDVIRLLAIATALHTEAPAQNAGEKPAPILQSKASATTKQKAEPQKEAPAVPGFAVAPMVLTDEGCAKDYVRAFQVEGVEYRKRIADLEAYGCLDTTARGIFAGVSTERKNLAVEKEHVAYFRKVVVSYDADRTKTAIGGGFVANPPGRAFYLGWILDEDFYAVSPEQFDRLLAEKKIPMRVTGNGR